MTDLVCAALVAIFVIARLPNQSHFYAPQVAALMTVVFLGLRLLITDAFNRDALAINACLLTTFGLLSSLLSAAPVPSIIGTSLRHTSLLTYVGALAVFTIARRTTERGTQLIARTYAWCVYISVGVAVLQLLARPENSALALIDDRAGGLSGHPVHLAAFCAGLIALEGWHLIRQFQWGRVTSIAIASFGIGITSSRIALATAMIAIAIIAVRSSQRWWACPAAITVGTAASWSTHVLVGGSRSIADRASGEGIGDRLELWKYALRAVSEQPLLGWGPGRFVVATQGFITPEWNRRFGGTFWDDAHNGAIEILTTWGIIGFALFTVFAMLVVQRGTGPMRMVILALVSCWAFEPAMAGTLGVIGVCAGVAVGPPVLWRTRWKGWPIEYAALLVAGILLGCSVIIGSVRINQISHGTQFEPFGTLEFWYWHDPDVAARFASLVPENAALNQGREYWLRRAIEIEPDNARNYTRLALYQITHDDIKGARASARTAIDLQPNQYAALTILHNVGKRTGDDALLIEARRRLCTFGDPDFC